MIQPIDHAPTGTILTPPTTRTAEQIDTYHGVEVSDPYRWLEDDVRESEEVAAWVAAQNEVTFAYLNGLPQREPLRQRFEALWDYEKVSAPQQRAGVYYVSRNTGLQNHSVLYRSGDAPFDGSNPEALEVVLDPNTYSEDGTTSLGGYRYSDDGQYLAFTVTEAGSDWKKIRVLNLQTMTELDDEIPWIKFSGAQWAPDSSGFYYGCFDPPAEGEAFQSSNLNMKVRFHRIGTDAANDAVVFSRPEQPSWTVSAGPTDDGDYLIVYDSDAGRANALSYAATNDPESKIGFVHGSPIEPIGLFTEWDAYYSFIGNEGSVFFIETDNDAPRGRLLAVDVSKAEEDPQRMVELIAESPDGATLDSVSHVGGRLFAQYQKDAHTVVRVYETDGTPINIPGATTPGELPLPGVGVASGFGGEPDEDETWFSFQSLTQPPTVYRMDVSTLTPEEFRVAPIDVDPSLYESKQVFITSKDGTQVPMFICHRRDLELDGSNPALLYGYGGFNVSMRPWFSVTRTVWMDLGGVWAMPNLRGGGEYGEAWHVAGTKTQKQNVFDDFIAAAEYLIAEHYTSSDHLAIQGGSNGGLLVGACMIQRPELFRAAMPAVGVMDMLRYHLFTAGRFWTFDYGTVDDADEFAALLAYSPVHNLQPGTTYPATMVTTADTDDRVVPGHSFKFAAALQAAHVDPEGTRPALIRIETSAGHGGGTPTSKALEQTADSYAFLCAQLGIDIAPDDARLNPTAD